MANGMAALAVYRGGVNVRKWYSLGSDVLHTTRAPDFAHITGVADMEGYRWLEVEFYDGRPSGFTRGDVTYLVGDLSLLGFRSFADVTLAQTALGGPGNAAAPAPAAPPQGAAKWPAPLSPYVITQGFGGAGGHLGVDLAAPVGTPIYSRGAGSVYTADLCAGCPGGVGAVAGTSDPRTNYGYGVNAVIRHAYADLPASAQAALDAAGLKGGWLFVRYAHLSRLEVYAAETVSAGDELGRVGSSGNSTGAHCHVETRGSLNQRPANVFAEPLIDPTAVFAL